jgi:hypothetical protein
MTLQPILQSVFVVVRPPGAPFIQNQYRIKPKADNLANKIVGIMKEQFGLKPKEQSYIYQHTYPEWFDKVPLPPQYRVPNFTKFSNSENVSTIEHMSCFLTQCEEASTQ